MLNINEQDKAVAEFLTQRGIKYSVKFLGAMDHDKEWQHDTWLITFTGEGNKVFNLEYKTGLGHRIEQTSLTGGFSLVQKNAIKALKKSTELQRVTFATGKTGKRFESYAVVPTQASVLYCVVSDLSMSEGKFYDFCDNCGYDSDSRKALAIYDAACKQSRDARLFFNNSVIQELQIMLEDY